jgi:hypothetical protein
MRFPPSSSGFPAKPSNGLPTNAIPERPSIPPNAGGMTPPVTPTPKPGGYGQPSMTRPGFATGWQSNGTRAYGNPAFRGGGMMQGWRDKLANALARR